MSRILLTGEKSKLGTAFRRYIEQHYPHDMYEITPVSVRGEAWKEADWSGFDVILHCAGIYHAPAQEYSYYEEINVKLTEAIAQKAVSSGVKQFIYLSTMDIYAPGVITADTVPQPQSLYGKSKLAAEQRLHEVLDGAGVKLAIIRCCPVIGKNAESKLEGYLKAFRLPVFPLMFTENKRSILHVDTLCELIRLIADEGGAGVYFPQNLPPLSVADILRTVKECTHSKTVLFKIPKVFWLRCGATERIYGSLQYDAALSDHFGGRYQTMDARQAIESVLP